MLLLCLLHKQSCHMRLGSDSHCGRQQRRETRRICSLPDPPAAQLDIKPARYRADVCDTLTTYKNWHFFLQRQKHVIRLCLMQIYNKALHSVCKVEPYVFHFRVSVWDVYTIHSQDCTKKLVSMACSVFIYVLINLFKSQCNICLCEKNKSLARWWSVWSKLLSMW